MPPAIHRSTTLLLIVALLFWLAPAQSWAAPPGVSCDESPAALQKNYSAAPRANASFSLGESVPLGMMSQPFPGRLDGGSLWRGEVNSQASSGSRWSRLSTAKKTWIIVGVVVGAAAIVAAVSGGGSNKGGGGGGGY